MYRVIANVGYRLSFSSPSLPKMKTKCEQAFRERDRQTEAVAQGGTVIEKLTDEIQGLKNEIRGYRRHVKLAKVDVAQRRAQQAATLVQTLRGEMKTMGLKLSRVTLVGEQRAEQIATMKVRWPHCIREPHCILYTCIREPRVSVPKYYGSDSPVTPIYTDI